MFKAEHMGVSPSQANSHTKSYSCSKHSTPGETPEYGAEYNCTTLSEQKHQIRSESVQTEPGDTSSVVSLCGVSEALQPSSNDVTKNSLTENLDPSPENPCKGSLTDKSVGPKLTAINQKLEFGSVDTQNELGAVSAQSQPAKGKVSWGSGILKDDNALSTFTINEASQSLPEDAAKNFLTKGLELPCQDVSNSQIDKSSCPQQYTSEQTPEFTSDGATCEPSEERKEPVNEFVQSELAEISTALSSCTATGHLESPPAVLTKSSLKYLGLLPDLEINIPATVKMEASHDDMDKHLSLGQSETPSKDAVGNSSGVSRRFKRTAKSSRKKYILRSLIRSDRVLRSRSQEKSKAPESSANLANVSSKIEKTRKKKKKRQGKRIEVDEYSRFRMHLRYLLNRISYEQSLITAYSAEGWKGLSLEKLKPEKELQRAQSEILRRKTKIRDLFQRIDSLCAEGRFPESLFDSEGQISSEDIFCAKCGSKDLTADNDIILCDGACDRGFHQFCLIPPLLKEDIPPDDEGWLCPGCDCKVDCIKLLNDSQGTNISISDSWEKIFPEAAAAGQNPDQNSGLPSDDSDDNDYDPDGSEINEKSQGDESSSDESDFTSASDELEAPAGDEQPMGLSSDDSEDENYDPDAPSLDEKVKEESSSSDFTSDSEDLAATLSNNKLSGEDESRMSIRAIGDFIKDGSKRGGIHSELLSILEPNLSQDGSASIPGKRNVERLDYKKLYDETYGNASSDPSDDEDFTDGASSNTGDDEDFTDDVGPRKRRKSAEVASTSVNGNAPVTNSVKQDLKETKYTPKRSRQMSNFENTNISTAKTAKAHQGSSPSGSCSKTVKSSVHRRLGEAVTQRLYKSFKENKYPNRPTKERLAEELGITFQQVSKWFENARWSFNHSPSMDASTIGTTGKDSPLPKTITELLTRGPETVSRSATCNGAQSEESPKIGDAISKSGFGDVRGTKLGCQESSKQKSKTSDSRKREYISDHQISDPDSTIEETEKIPANLQKPQEVQIVCGVTRSKSVA